jgi:hypothetical protein
MALRQMVVKALKLLPVTLVLLLLGAVLFNVSAVSKRAGHHRSPSHADRLLRHGRHVFRFDTFGDQAFWGGALQLHKAIEGAKLGGVGPGVSPKTALALGLKVDSRMLPKSVARAIRRGQVNLNSPKTTLALLRLNAVVGLKGFFNRRGTLRSVGITCAVCHSTVDNSFAPGIGRRRDGWPNRDLNVGAIVNAAPNLKPVADVLRVPEPTVRKAVTAWGPGKFDAELFIDGKAFRPDGKTAATLLPPAFGLAGVNLHTYTGWGSIPYWNAFVANLEMHGSGRFFDSRLDDPVKFPVAARLRLGHTDNHPDLISSKLPALHFYQLALRAPRPSPRSFNHRAARRGKAVFMGRGRCASCHTPPTFSEPGWNLHRPSEICTDSFQAGRSPTGMYRTTPLRGLFAHRKGGFYHDGRFKSLGAVVNHYNRCFGLSLSPRQKRDLVQYLKSL